MRICPDDLESCRRATCAGGTCERTGERPLTHCVECGVIATGHSLVLVCAECATDETPLARLEG